MWDPLPYGYAPTSDGMGHREYRSKLQEGLDRTPELP